MPLGFEQRFTYSDTPMLAFGRNTGISPYTTRFSGTPLIGYEALYGFRSGKRSNELLTGGSYASSVLSGRDLFSQLQARKKYLEDLIQSSFEPTNGPPSVFSTTDVGHPFATFKVRTHAPFARIFYKNATNDFTWDVCPSMAGLPYPNLTDPFGFSYRTDSAAVPMGKQTYFAWPSTLTAFGNQASVSQQTIPNSLKQTLGAGLIAGTNPWKSKADLAVTIGELLTGNLPRILSRIGESLIKLKIDWKLQTGRELSKHTNPGNEWLSLWFGWAPLVRDIQAAIGVLYKLHVLIYDGSDSERRRFAKGDLVQMNRIRTDGFTAAERSFQFTSALNNTTASPYFKNYEIVGPAVGAPVPTGLEGEFAKTVSIQSDFRFAARFHRGALPNARERDFLSKALDLLGLDITPATVYQLAPWSWLLDWFSSLGNAVQNLSALDWSNVLLDYSYLTLKVKTISTSAVTLPSSWGTGGSVSSSSPFITQRVEAVEKIREQASPYGFSVNWAGLSPFQLSILASLGMTRGR